MPISLSFSAQAAPSPHRLVVPAAYLSQLEVMLPPTPAHRLQAALAGALEEQLLDDPADLHLAVAPDAAEAMKAGRAFGVLVCDRVWLERECSKRRAAGQHITSIVPATTELAAAGWDLAQFDFRAQSVWSHRLQAAAVSLWYGSAWRLARIALLLLVVVQIVGLNVWAWRDRADLAAKREQISRILTQTFPQTQVVVDAPAQMTRAVAALRQGSGAVTDKDLESLLAASPKGQVLRKIDYSDGVLKTQFKGEGTP